LFITFVWKKIVCGCQRGDLIFSEYFANSGGRKREETDHQFGVCGVECHCWLASNRTSDRSPDRNNNSHPIQTSVSEFGTRSVSTPWCQTQMSIKVIGAGWGRTGTLTLKTALEKLTGGACYHMVEVLENPQNRNHVLVWQDAADGKPVDWEQLLQNYTAVVDWPGCNYWRELMATFPDAKVVLTVRSFESWYNSVNSTIKHFWILSANPPWLAPPRLRKTLHFLQTTVADRIFQNRFHEREFARSLWEAHIEDVKRSVPADRLLVYEVRQGWEPLCKFLNLPVPNVPFPNSNNNEEFTQHFRLFFMKVRLMRLLPLILLSIVVMVLLWWHFWF
jgi:hypothetical protein